MRKIAFLLGALLFYTITNYSQSNTTIQNSNWIIGNSHRLNFTTYPPTVSSIKQDDSSNLPDLQDSGYASVSDIFGNLLFVTDGEQIWRYLHGSLTSIGNIGPKPDPTIRQNLIIVPKPYSPNSFYILTVVNEDYEGYPSGVYYTEYEIADGNDLGTVIYSSQLQSYSYGSDFQCTSITSWLGKITPNNNYPVYQIIVSNKDVNNLEIYNITSSGIEECSDLYLPLTGIVPSDNDISHIAMYGHGLGAMAFVFATNQGNLFLEVEIIFQRLQLRLLPI